VERQWREKAKNELAEMLKAQCKYDDFKSTTSDHLAGMKRSSVCKLGAVRPL
jgi:hypothetical protein